MNGANCSSSCHISRAETKPLLTQKTMSLCKSQRPTETSPQPRTTRWVGGCPALPVPCRGGNPTRHRDSRPSATACLPAQPGALQPPPGRTGDPRSPVDHHGAASHGSACPQPVGRGQRLLLPPATPGRYREGKGRFPARSRTPSRGAAVRRARSIPPPPAWNNSQEDEKCHKLFSHKRDEKGEEGEEESL